MSFATLTEPDVSVASHGADELVMPPTTHRFSDVQARVKIELRSVATFDHECPKLTVRTTRQPVESLASPRHLRPAQWSDVSAAQVTVEKLERSVHVAPPSLVT